MSDNEITGRAKGGHRRAEVLSDERLSEIAKKAAQSRWGIRATHRGNFKEDFGIDVDCYVLDDEKKTAVISMSGLVRALGLAPRGGALQRLLRGRAFAKTAVAELLEKIEKPLKFQWGTGGAEQPPSVVHGFDVTLLIDICKVISKAASDGVLLERHQNIAKQANVIVNACAKSGIQNLVYKLAGYDATKEEVITAFKLFIREEAREYEKEFPDPLYKEWYRLYGIPEPERNRPWKFKHLTVDQVYKPLARSSGKILELTKACRAKSTERHKRLHQFLSDVGVKALRTHLGQLLGIAQVSKDKGEYEKHIEAIFGDEPRFNF